MVPSVSGRLDHNPPIATHHSPVSYPLFMDVRCLSIHANYRCAHSGTCCRTGWHLPVAPDALVFLTNALESGALRTSRSTDDDRPFQAPNDAPRDVAAIVAADSSGACVFLDSDTRCAIHRQLDIGRLPVPCQQFPRVSVLGPDHTSVTLSHYCPTAARMLVDSPADLRIVRAPASLLTAGSLDGLDVRDAIPPLLRPGTLMGWPEYERWEHHLVHTLNRDELTPEQAVRALVDDAEAVRGWAADVASLGEHLEEICERRVAWMPETSEGAVDLERARSLQPSPEAPCRKSCRVTCRSWSHRRCRHCTRRGPDGSNRAGSR